MDGRGIRINRMFSDRRVVIIAMDHGMFDGPIEGIIDVRETIGKINTDVDGVLLAPGMLRHCAELFAAPQRPLAVVRLNWNTVYCFHWNYKQACAAVASRVEDAVCEGMDIALVSLTLQTGDESRDAANIQVFCDLVSAAHRLGVPVIGEYFPSAHEKMSPDQLHDAVYSGSRIIAELGADAIKTFYTNRFSEVVASCPIPVMGLGAEKLANPVDALDLAAREVAAGAKGVVFGRNAIQADDPIAFQSALIDVVRHNTSASDAGKQWNLMTAKKVGQ